MESVGITDLICNFSGFSRIFGYPVGIIGNNGVLFSESAKKVNIISIQRKEGAAQALALHNHLLRTLMLQSLNTLDEGQGGVTLQL